MSSPTQSSLIMDAPLALDPPPVVLNGVTRVFGLVPAVVRVDLRVSVGETLLIRGPNGAGKSTLLRLIATALSPTYGSGTVLGHDLVTGRDEIRRSSELLGHRTRLYGTLTAAENLRFVCALQGIAPARVSEVLERVGLSHVGDERVRGFSMGMRQRLAIARALLRRPDLLLLDEPYAGLDAEAKDLVDEAILDAQRSGDTVIVATHETMRRAEATRTVVMEEGRIVSDDAADGAAHRPIAIEPARARSETADAPGVTLLRQTLSIAGKDLQVETRGRQVLNTVLPFAGTLLIAFGLSLGPGRSLLQEAAPGLLWLAVLFASVLAFGQTYESEGQDGALEGLLLAPIDAVALFLGKAAAVTVELLALEVVIVVLVSAMFGLSLGQDPTVLAGVLVLGTIGLCAVGSLFGVLNESPTARGSVFPVLVLPLATPVLIAGVKATALASSGQGLEAGSWLGLLLAFDLVFLATGSLVFAYLLED